MILKSLRLKNIRSYSSAEIEFPTGTVLLSGDIGAGKSSILLSIEFALFGVRRNELMGSTLLRHGATDGSVELSFSVDEHDVTVLRMLRRGKNDISQGAGYMILNGQKEELTPVELKSRILNLLGYPEDSLTKKDLIYRYTVYTPQEQMKQIILEDAPIRLATLTKLFGMDKYKQARDNTMMYLRYLKERKRFFEGLSDGIDEKKKEQNALHERIRKLLEDEKSKAKELETLEKSALDIEDELKSLDKAVEEKKQAKSELKVTIEALKIREERKRQIALEFEAIDRDIAAVKKEIGDLYRADPESIDAEKRKIEEGLKTAEKRLNDEARKLNTAETITEQSRSLVNKIVTLKKCPTCEQDVTNEHKKVVISRENCRIKEQQTLIESARKGQEEAKAAADLLKKKQSMLAETEKKMIIAKQKGENLVKMSERKAILDNEARAADADINTLLMKKETLSKSAESGAEASQKHLDCKNRLELEMKKVKDASVDLARIREGLSGTKQQSGVIGKEIKKKEQACLAQKKALSIQGWLEGLFLPLTGTIERHVLASIYFEFNEFFQQWFSVLVEDEQLSVKLDDSFSVIVEQNGYESSVGNLSGGERTAVALAYRLALNKAVGEMIGTIRTKDLIILDEPTDGFSSEQLDRMREVIEQLNVRQTIIVSHEPKIESFVDCVIRITKDDHVSRVGV